MLINFFLFRIVKESNLLTSAIYVFCRPFRGSKNHFLWLALFWHYSAYLKLFMQCKLIRAYQHKVHFMYLASRYLRKCLVSEKAINYLMLLSDEEDELFLTQESREWVRDWKK